MQKEFVSNEIDIFAIILTPNLLRCFLLRAGTDNRRSFHITYKRAFVLNNDNFGYFGIIVLVHFLNGTSLPGSVTAAPMIT